MHDPLVRQIADAVLYEGYLLYPYRLSALKNRMRWLFGRVFPDDYRTPGGAEGPLMRTEFLALDHGEARLSVRLRFLQVGSTGDEATERSLPCEASIAQLVERTLTVPFEFPDGRQPEVLCQAEDRTGELPMRERRAINGTLELSAVPVGGRACRVAVEIRNQTPLAEHEKADEQVALAAAFVSTHLLLGVEDGEFASLLDPPEPLRAAAAACRQTRLWPVLVGAEGSRGAMLAAPIILDDYPRVAPESAGDLFDGTEIDELLTLRVRTLSESEKHEIRSAGGPARTLLERSEALADEPLRQLHGGLRSSLLTGGRPAPPLTGGDEPCAPSPKHSAGGVRNAGGMRPGVRVRLRPRGRADAFDILLDGRTAVIAAIEQDFEDRVHVAVTIDDDPGRDLGALGMPGHRFFFGVDELELLD